MQDRDNYLPPPKRVAIYRNDSLVERQGEVLPKRGLPGVRVRIDEPSDPNSRNNVWRVTRIESFARSYPGLRPVSSNNVDGDFGLQAVLRI